MKKWLIKRIPPGWSSMSTISPVQTVATLPNELQLRPCWIIQDKVTVCTGHYYYVRAGLHVPYKSKLIITWMSMHDFEVAK